MSLHDVHAAVARLSRLRHGVIYEAELAERLSPAQVRTCVRTGLLRREATGVYLNPAIPRSAEQEIGVAIGAAGGAYGRLAASGHRSACALWELVEHPAVPEVVVQGPRRLKVKGAIVRRSVDLSPDDVVSHRRLLVVKPMLAVLQLGAVEGPTVVGEAISRAARRRLFRPKALEVLLAERARCGRDGVVNVRAALRSLPVGERPLDSVIEYWFHLMALRFGLPELVFQHTTSANGRTVRIDFALPSVLLAIEIDDYESHAGEPAGWRHDIHRRNDLGIAGWAVLQFTWHDLRDRPEWVAQQVRQMLGRLGVAA